MEIYETKDGSSTLYSSEFKEHYHSRKEGALSESLYKHVIPALKYTSVYKKKLRVLDICFGLGYNTFATIYYVKNFMPEVSVEIYSPEFDGSLVNSLIDFEYPREFDGIKQLIDETIVAHQYTDERCSIELYIGKAEEYIKTLNTNSIDIVYQDAFSPKKNPTLWSEEFFADIHRVCAPRAMLTTYSSARSVRDNLQSVGFNIEKHIGEGFSKEGIKAFKIF